MARIPRITQAELYSPIPSRAAECIVCLGVFVMTRTLIKIEVITRLDAYTPECRPRFLPPIYNPFCFAPTIYKHRLAVVSLGRVIVVMITQWACEE